MGILAYFKKKKQLKRNLIGKLHNKDYASVKQKLINEIKSENYYFVESVVRKEKGLPKEHLKELSDVLKNMPKPKIYQFYKSLCYISLEQSLESSPQSYSL